MQLPTLPSIRIGRRIYSRNGTFTDPKLPVDFPPHENIHVLTQCSAYGSLGPYVLTDDKGRIMENIYQSKKVYQRVPASLQRYSRWDKKVIWDHPAETHVDEKSQLTPEYWSWRKKLSRHDYAVRYPVGFYGRSKCLYALKRARKYTKKEKKQGVDIEYVQLDYIEGRKQIYAPVYISLVRKEPQYEQLLEKLRSGQNLLIIEVDGPHQEDLDYYKEKYEVEDDFIVGNTMDCTKKNISIMLNDPKHPFGHGYCLGLSLLADLQGVDYTEFLR